MDLMEALYEGARISCGWRWLCSDGIEYQVYERKMYKKKTQILLSTHNLEKALIKLMED